MKKNKLLLLLKSFTKAEISAFRKYIRSDYFTRREDYRHLFEALLLQLTSKQALDKQQLFQKAYPLETFNDLKLRAALSDLKAQLEKFLVIQQVLEEDTENNIRLLEIFNERKLGYAFQQKLKKVETTLAKTSKQDLNYFQQKLRTQQLKATLLASQKRTADLPLQEISEQIDINFMIEKLRHACSQLTHQLVYKTQYDFGLLKNVLLILERGQFLHIPAIRIRYYCFQFLSHPEEKEFFDQFRDLLFAQEAQFERKELKDLYLLGINFCIRQLNQGNTFYPQELWKLYQQGLAADVFLDDGRLSRFTFNNVIGIGINLKEFTWLDHFVEQYKNYLAEEDKDSIIYFNQARVIYHAKKDHEAVIQLLQKVNFKDIVENLMSKTMLSKVYYELKEFDLLDYHLTSFQQYIRRHKLGKYHTTNYNNIILLLRKLLNVFAYDKAQKQKLRTEILETEVLTEREWLLEQL
ncbi:MAG: hypothetical protein AB8G15_13865 [Saprospiraceae bacterium]